MSKSKKDNRYCRSEFENDLNHLKESMLQSKFHLSEDLGRTTDSLHNVRKAPNQRYDLSTVNGMVRALAINRYMMNMEETLKIKNDIDK